MPLKPGKSKKVLSENISELARANPNRSIKQDAAIAYAKQRESEKKTKS